MATGVISPPVPPRLSSFFGSIKGDSRDSLVPFQTKSKFNLSASEKQRFANIKNGDTVKIICTGETSKIGPILLDCSLDVPQAPRINDIATLSESVTPQAAPNDSDLPKLNHNINDSQTRPSFECNKARSVSEKLICSDAELSRLDAELAEIYYIAKAAAPDKREFATENSLRWKEREQTCTDKKCLISWFISRKSELTKLALPANNS